MDDARLSAANTLLSHPPATGLSLSRTLGLHVVAHLAARHGIIVQLRRAEPSGVTALVVLPAELLASAPTDGSDDRPEHAPRPPSEPVLAEVVDAAGAETSGELVLTAVGPTSDDEPDPVAWDRPDDDLDGDHEPEPATVGATAEFPRRVPGASGNGHGNGNGNGHSESNGNGLTARVPGANLTHVPSEGPAMNGDVRPRPERVHDLLSRHERGKQAGQERGGE
jgi:hypothetical protein